MADNQFTLGETLGGHAADIAAMKSDIASIQSDVREIRDIVVERRGERRVATIGFGAVGGLASPILFRFLLAKLGLHQ